MSTIDFLNLAQAAVSRAMERGADSAEAYISRSKELEIEVREQQIETIKSSEEKGLGLRVLRGRQFGFAFTTNLTPSGIEDVAAQAVANAGQTAPDEFYSFPAKTDGYSEMSLFDPALQTTNVERKIELAKEMERAARTFDKRVKVIESSTYHDGEIEVGLVSSEGMESYYRAALCGLYMALTAQGGGENQTGFAVDYRRRIAELDPEKIGREAAERAVRMLGSRTQGSCKIPVVLDPYVVVSLLGVIAPSLTAEAVQKGRSLFAGRVGEQVSSPLITLIDDGTYEDGIRTAPFDGEGVPTQRTVLINEGVLQGYLHNTYTAAKDGTTRSTGNGVRGSFKSTPEVGTTNFYIAPGTRRAETIIGETKQGMYITEVMGIHTANPISGDFSVGAAGIWISEGQLAQPVRGVAIAGNIKDLLSSIDAVGDDLRFLGGKGSPTIRVEKMALSGS
ncbi:MAG: TldD/PmbA family protein [Bacillota bacterium]